MSQGFFLSLYILKGRKDTMTKIRTRFAPSPTGRMHVGNLRTALYAYLIAKHEGGDFILRIEDTDQERYVEGAVDIIYRTMAGTGLIHDEGPDKDKGYGPYVQSERQASGLYLKYAQQLIEQGDAYYCFCGPEELESMKRVVAGKEISIYDKRCLRLSKEEVQRRLDAGEPHVIRFNMPTEGTTTFHDVIYGDITVNNEEMEDLILIKSDGYPTYNFANVIDDHLMGITHVVRGNEYLSSAPKYNRIYEAFGWEIPVYVHCPLITNEEHQKLPNVPDILHMKTFWIRDLLQRQSLTLSHFLDGARRTIVRSSHFRNWSKLLIIIISANHRPYSILPSFAG